MYVVVFIYILLGSMSADCTTQQEKDLICFRNGTYRAVLVLCLDAKFETKSQWENVKTLVDKASHMVMRECSTLLSLTFTDPTCFKHCVSDITSLLDSQSTRVIQILLFTTDRRNRKKTVYKLQRVLHQSVLDVTVCLDKKHMWSLCLVPPIAGLTLAQTRMNPLKRTCESANAYEKEKT